MSPVTLTVSDMVVPAIIPGVTFTEQGSTVTASIEAGADADFAAILSPGAGAPQIGTLVVLGPGSGAFTGTGSMTLGAIEVGDGGTLSVFNYDNEGLLAHSIIVDAGGELHADDVLKEGLIVNGTVTVDYSDTGTLDLLGNVTGSGTLAIASYAALQLGGVVSATDTIAFTGKNESLIINRSAMVSAQVAKFGPKDFIALENEEIKTAEYNDQTHILSLIGAHGSTADLTIEGNYQQGNFVVSTGSNPDVAPGIVTFQAEAICFCAGTHILTPMGPTPIESLAIGDAVVTRFSGIQIVKWIGQQRFAKRFLKRDPGNMPVRIAAGALGPHMPARDLFVSPGHSMLIEKTLILARNLVNGITITQCADNMVPDVVEYFNIELASHDCVIAEGTFSETFADGPGLRSKFHNEAEYWKLFPDDLPPDELIPLCAPRPERGAELGRILQPIVARAAAGRTLGSMEGFVDLAAGFQVEGWAMDNANPLLPVLLDIFMENHVVATVLAADFRPDLLAAGKGRGYCAFSATLPVRVNLGTLRICRHQDGAPLCRRADMIAA